MVRALALIATVILTLPVSFAGSAWAAGGGGGGGYGPSEDFKSQTYKSGVKAIKDGDFQAGVDLMTKAIAETPKDADAYNWLGYAYRRQKDYDNAIKFYTKALEIDPDHRGAHEYLGEAYLELNNLDEAKKHLVALDNICWLGCQEYSLLKSAVQAYEKKAKT